MVDSSRFSRSLDDSNAVQIAVLVLFLVVVVVLCLHFCAKRNWWQADDENSSGLHQLRRRRRRRFVFAPGQDLVAATRKGLDPLVLRALPVVVFPSEDFKDGLECAVCLSELVHGEKARLLTKCNHGFHVDCIDMWFQSHSTCPLCRNPVVPETSLGSSSAGSSSSFAESSGDGVVQIQSPAESLVSGFPVEAPNFPTNVLFCGNQSQASSRPGLEEGPSSQATCTSSSSSSSASTVDGVLVIDIPSEASSAFSSPSPSPSPSGNSFAAEEDLKSPVTTRLRSLKRLLSRDRRISPCSPSSVDVEQGGRGGGQSLKAAIEYS